MEWDQADIVHFKSYNPDNQIRGMSRLEPLRQTILNEDAARRAAGAFWGTVAARRWRSSTRGTCRRTRPRSG
jgi:hypothetical protein